MVEPATSPIAPNSQIATANSQNTARVIIIKPKTLNPSIHLLKHQSFLKNLSYRTLALMITVDKSIHLPLQPCESGLKWRRRSVHIAGNEDENHRAGSYGKGL
ncbi:MAG: hypothetical protein HZT40_04270 [Candidatus Thiothrix singaporensis]|uniref:Uncharacterized protein n=1 Tax=Candidatus Thiothrix singaporensis TaxID=2799669 RepID=A0A7L6APH1_9GAMM|nr:MAG: hypothetical protein HZT40_04270 [Candidatus Thiothrix singaporensis]